MFYEYSVNEKNSWIIIRACNLFSDQPFQTQRKRPVQKSYYIYIMTRTKRVCQGRVCPLDNGKKRVKTRRRIWNENLSTEDTSPTDRLAECNTGRHLPTISSWSEAGCSWSRLPWCSGLEPWWEISSTHNSTNRPLKWRARVLQNKTPFFHLTHETHESNVSHETHVVLLGPVAHLVEHCIRIAGVDGSNPIGSTRYPHESHGTYETNASYGKS